MRAAGPHFLLYSTAPGIRESDRQWRFILRPVGGEASLAVADVEENAKPGRLELLAVVRGLEALEQPSRVTLVTSSRYVIRGIRRGLSQWRERGWRWERFGQIVPIRDDDLWQRVVKVSRQTLQRVVDDSPLHLWSHRTGPFVDRDDSARMDGFAAVFVPVENFVLGIRHLQPTSGPSFDRTKENDSLATL